MRYYLGERQRVKEGLLIRFPDVVTVVYHRNNVDFTHLDQIPDDKNMRNRFLAQFYIGHGGATLFLKVISREVRAD